jgi:cytoskeleton protein RodZ
MTIGERLEDARKRKGISIREVAEATKIRGDYLMAMEDNSMDIPLPEIYKRGFLINYAKFLKLDANKIITDYTALKVGSSGVHRERPAHHEDREVFGRMELEEDEDGDDVPPPSRDPAVSGATRQTPPAHPSAVLTDNTLYLKIAAGLMGVVLVVFIVIVIVNLLRSGDEPVAASETPVSVTNTVTEGPATITESSDPRAEPAVAGPSNIILRATTENVIIIVDDIQTRERLFSGTLRAGDTQLIEREGPVNIKFSNGGALEIEMPDGSKVRPTAPAMGQTQL